MPPAKVGVAPEPRPGGVLLEENKLIAEREARDIDDWITRQGVAFERTGTGVRIKLVRDSAGVQARPGQLASIAFAVYLINGTRCYSSAPGVPEEFRIEQDNVESGLHEAVQLMSIGDSAIIVIPSHRAFGLIGDEKKIPMRSTVIYHMGLVGLR